MAQIVPGYNRAVRRSTGNHEHAWKMCRTFKIWQITFFQQVQHRRCQYTRARHLQQGCGPRPRCTRSMIAPWQCMTWRYFLGLLVTFLRIFSLTAILFKRSCQGLTPFLCTFRRRGQRIRFRRGSWTPKRCVARRWETYISLDRNSAN